MQKPTFILASIVRSGLKTGGLVVSLLQQHDLSLTYILHEEIQTERQQPTNSQNEKNTGEKERDYTWTVGQATTTQLEQIHFAYRKGSTQNTT